MAGLRQRVDGPAPSAPPRTIEAAVSVVEDDLPVRWASGVVLDPAPCGCADVWAPDCDAPEENFKQEDDLTPGDLDVEVDAFSVIHTQGCSTLGLDLAAQDAEARDAFDAHQWPAIEAELWTGTLLPTNPHLDAAGADELTPEAVELTAAVAALEAAIAATCQAGVIHMAPQAAVWAGRFGLLVDRGAGSPLRTILGTPVAVGSGYTGTGPDGLEPDPGETYVYATGPVQVRLAPVVVLPSVDHRTNRRVIRVEREAIAIWDPGCLHAAQRVWLGHTTGTPPADAGSGSGS